MNWFTRKDKNIQDSAKKELPSDLWQKCISILTYPTTGGVTASFGMQADITIAEPKALIGFAGQRVIKQTTSQELPDNFQTAEFLLEKGFIDLVVDRNNLKDKLDNILSILK